MSEEFSRTALLIGEESLETLSHKTVAVFGVGGVGGYVVEALARSGIGHLVLIDNDTVSVSNINRQIIATHKSVGLPKVDVAKERVLDINPDIIVDTYQTFYLPENREKFDFSKYDYVVDAVDTITAKIDIIVRCKENDIPVISAMGAGNKMNPEMMEITDIFKTEMDPLSKVMRHELKKRNIKNLKVVYSKEKPLKPLYENKEETVSGKIPPGSIAFVPSVSGLLIASEVIKDLINFNHEERE